MNGFKKACILISGFLMVSFSVPCHIYAQQPLYAGSNISSHPIEVRKSSEIDIPKSEPKKKQTWLSKNKWWVIGGLAVIAGAAAASGGGGGSSSDAGAPPLPTEGSPAEAEADTGAIPVSW